MFMVDVSSYCSRVAISLGFRLKIRKTSPGTFKIQKQKMNVTTTMRGDERLRTTEEDKLKTKKGAVQPQPFARSVLIEARNISKTRTTAATEASDGKETSK
jgi:hypothetical protein